MQNKTSPSQRTGTEKLKAFGWIDIKPGLWRHPDNPNWNNVPHWKAMELAGLKKEDKCRLCGKKMTHGTKCLSCASKKKFTKTAVMKKYNALWGRQEWHDFYQAQSKKQNISLNQYISKIIAEAHGFEFDEILHKEDR